MLANIHLILASESWWACLYDTHDVGLPTQFRFNVWPVSQPIAEQIVYDAVPILLQHLVCCILSGSTTANTCHLPDTVSMSAQRLRRWPDIGTAFGDCPVFARTAMRVTLYSSRLQKSHYPDNTMHRPNADVMLGHRLWCWTNTIPTLSLIWSLIPYPLYNREYIFFLASSVLA